MGEITSIEADVVEAEDMGNNVAAEMAAIGRIQQRCATRMAKLQEAVALQQQHASTAAANALSLYVDP